jgi:hypothetical protein
MALAAIGHDLAPIRKLRRHRNREFGPCARFMEKNPTKEPMPQAWALSLVLSHWSKISTKPIPVVLPDMEYAPRRTTVYAPAGRTSKIAASLL